MSGSEGGKSNAVSKVTCSPPSFAISSSTLDDPNRVDGLQVEEGGVEGVSGVGEAAGPVFGGAGERRAFKGNEVHQPRIARGGERAQIARVQFVGEKQLVDEGVDEGFEAGTFGPGV